MRLGLFLVLFEANRPGESLGQIVLVKVPTL